MSIFDRKKIALLKQKIELKKQEAISEGRFSLFNARCVIEMLNKTKDYKAFKYCYDLVEENDKKCKIPYNLGIFLEQTMQEYTILVHRTNLGIEGEDIPKNDALYDIMKNGLQNFGHTNVGGITSTNTSLMLTTTVLNGLSGYINLISRYKNNDTVVLMAIPKEYVDENGDVKDESFYQKIYDIYKNQQTIKPEYILGAIIKREGKIDDFYIKDEIIDKQEKNNEKN